MSVLLNVPADSGFGLANLPYGVFSKTGSEKRRIGVRFGDSVVDLSVLADHGLFDGAFSNDSAPFHASVLNPFMALGTSTWDLVRARLTEALSAPAGCLHTDAELADKAVVRLSDVQLHLPVAIGDYTDFYSSRQHATNVGIMFRGVENALMPNWLHMPIGYHGRASSIVVSDSPVRRPCGQTRPDPEAPPVFGPSKQLDFELELGVLVGTGNTLGEPIPVDEAGDHIFGYVIVNDWSARDLQKWEYVPLGPFLGKSFATSMSPWVVPAAALDPFRVPGEPQDAAAGNPEPLDYLRQGGKRALDVRLAVTIESAEMRRSGIEPLIISNSNAKYLYWSPEQQMAHHTVNGCNLRPGDLYASGTISGNEPDSFGSLLEIAWKGTKPLSLPDGTTRTFLADGDRVFMTGVAERDGMRISFGEVVGEVIPAT